MRVPTNITIAMDDVVAHAVLGFLVADVDTMDRLLIALTKQVLHWRYVNDLDPHTYNKCSRAQSAAWVRSRTASLAKITLR